MIPHMIKMAIFINSCRALFLAITSIVSLVASVTCLTDVQTTTRWFWIGLAVTCMATVSSWKTKEKQNENIDLDLSDVK
jgi:formate hydrogenlyase subunit 3/multisubunit Na+/H+ antiporter MnhD subunit